MVLCFHDGREIKPLQVDHTYLSKRSVGVIPDSYSNPSRYIKCSMFSLVP